MYECFHCLTKSVGWCADFNAEELGYQKEGLVHLLHCSNCGAEIEYFVPDEVEE